jgi:hypothetical protein
VLLSKQKRLKRRKTEDEEARKAWSPFADGSDVSMPHLIIPSRDPLLAGGSQLAGTHAAVRVAAKPAKSWWIHAGRRLRPQIRLRLARRRGGQPQPAAPAS